MIVDKILYGGCGGGYRLDIPLGLLLQSWESPKMQCSCSQCGGIMYLYGLQLHAGHGSIIGGSAYCPNCNKIHKVSGNPNGVKAREFVQVMQELCGCKGPLDIDFWNQSMPKRFKDYDCDGECKTNCVE